MMLSPAIETCRLCHGPLTETVLQLGEQPISNRLSLPGSEPARRYPLELVLCTACGLPQLGHDLPASAHFHDDYTYISGASSTWVAHCRDYAADVVKRFDLKPGDFVVEIGSNDGTLLKALAAHNLRVLGVEPSDNVAEIARGQGVDTLTAFFNEETARRVAAEHGRPKAIIGNNVLAHVPDTAGFLSAAAGLIADDGALCFEYPHNRNILHCRYFDTIYHEHYTYLGVGPLDRWARAHGMAVSDALPQTTHGGSLRTILRKGEQVTPEAQARIDAALAAEEGVDDPARWQALQVELAEWRDALLAMLAGYRARGLNVAGYAAASKATVLANFVGLDASLVACCGDASPLKQGRLIPGAEIPIVSPTELCARQPDIVLIFAWNIFDEVAAQLSAALPPSARLVRLLPTLAEVAATAPASA